MSLETQLLEDMKTAMKSGDKIVLETVRGLRSQIKNAQIDKGEALGEEDIVAVLTSAAKKRREAIEQFRAGGREDRAADEEAELKVIMAYLPEQMDEAAITAIVVDAIGKSGASSPKDMGKVMGMIMGKLKGKADGKLVQQIVKNKLGA